MLKPTGNKYNYIIQDDRTTEEIKQTVGIIIARDTFLSGWGKANDGTSYIGCPFSDEEDRKRKLRRFNLQNEMKNVHVAYEKFYKPRLKNNDHYHICNLNSFIYAL